MACTHVADDASVRANWFCTGLRKIPRAGNRTCRDSDGYSHIEAGWGPYPLGPWWVRRHWRTVGRSTRRLSDTPSERIERFARKRNRWQRSLAMRTPSLRLVLTYNLL